MLPITCTTAADAQLCPIRQVFAKVTGKWQVLILLSLEDGALRFNEIRRAVGDVTQRVLTENLRSLERDGYLSRTVKAGPPVAVSYELTSLGLSLVQVLKGVVAWANDSFPQVTAARAAYDERVEEG